MRTQTEGPAVVKRGESYDFSTLRLHLIGIGGTGMSGAAGLLAGLGADVSGSDLVGFDGMGALVSAGARVAIGHQADQLDQDLDLVVISAAIPESNPELAAARRRGLPVMQYAELVGHLMRGCAKGIAISGTHGKSTTTAMCVFLFREAGLEPSFLIGARSDQLGGSSGLGAGTHFVAEACEFNRSFLQLAPESGAILNLEFDHADCYRNLDEIVEAFARFAASLDPAGRLIVPADDDCARRAAATSAAEVESFGFESGADWQATGLRCDRGLYEFDVRYRGTVLMSTRLSVPGQYNVSNALAATALAYHAGADPQAMAEALPRFAGVSRRMTWRGEGRGVTILDDYAHHPTEIRVTIEAAQRRYRPKRTWVIFQPHQHARTRHFMHEFAGSFEGVDEVIVPDVYGARETNETSASPPSRVLADRIRESGGRARYVPNLDAIADLIVERLMEGDLVMTMGAGDVWKVADELVARVCGPDRA